MVRIHVQVPIQQTIVYSKYIMVTISLDYDNTYTAAPEMWLDFIKNAPPHVKIYCVTMRWEGEADSMDPRLKAAVPVIFTARQAKRPYCEAQGIKIDIWIDDMPDWIIGDSF